MNFLKKTFNYLNRRDHHLLPKNLNFTKIILILLACFAVTFSAKTILADNTTCGDGETPNADTGRCEKKNTTPVLYNSEFQEKLTEKQAALEDTNINAENWISSSADTNGLIIINALAGNDTTAMTTKDSGWVPNGLIGSTNKVIASLYAPPISGVQYIADSINSFMGKPAYAANNDGFNQLKGIQPLWKICRNTVYTLISVIFVVMGLMIMLRIKISPQATVTIQNSIPKIITTLILVTFSYAICGLIIDLTYLIQALVLSLITQTDSANIFTGNIDLPHLIKGGWDAYWSLAYKTMSNANFSTTGWTISILGGIVGVVIGAFAGPLALAGAVFGGIIGLAILLIFTFIQLIKFLFGCAKAYIILLLKIISAPLEIALGAFPNSKIGFSSWFIQTIAYASVFPICLIFLVILNVILNAVTFNQVWTPGVLQGNAIGSYVGGIVGLSGLIILAKLPNLIPEAIFQLKPSPFGKALNETIAPIGRTISGAATGAVRSGVSANLMRGDSRNKLAKWWIGHSTTTAPGPAQNQNQNQGQNSGPGDITP